MTPKPSQLQRQRTLEEASKAAEHEQAKRRVDFALRHPSEPKGEEATAALEQLSPGSRVLVYRTKSKKWEGLHRFVSLDGETVVVKTVRGRKIFSSVCVRPYNQTAAPSSEEGDCKNAASNKDCKIPDDARAYAASDGEYLVTQPRKVTVKPRSKEEAMFAAPRLAKLEGLVKNRTLKPIKLSKVPKKARIFNTRFVDEIKRAEKGLKKKSRFVSQSWRDEDATEIATKAPTVQRYSQRTTLSIAACYPDFDPFLRDIIQDYIQSLTRLERRFFIRAPKELGLPDDMVLEGVRPLYRIPQSGLHWYLTYLSHHLETLGMIKSKVDPCVLIRRERKNLKGLVLLQVDDSLGFGDNQFLDQEDEASTRFNSKPRIPLTEQPSTFNGIR